LARVSSPWLIGRSQRAESIPAHFVNSGAGPRPPLCAGMLNVSIPRSQKSRIASAIGTESCALRTGLCRSSTADLTRLTARFAGSGCTILCYPAVKLDKHLAGAPPRAIFSTVAWSFDGHYDDCGVVLQRLAPAVGDRLMD